MHTIARALACAVDGLKTTSPTPDLDAQVLLCYCLGRDTPWCLVHGADSIQTREREAFNALVARRLQGEPVAYLTGVKEFWSLDFAVGRGVLIPRPETELVVERALAHIPGDQALSIADLGTGCGAIALAVAKERPRCSILATDQSPEALVYATKNAGKLCIPNVEVKPSCWFKGLAEKVFDLILTNPPYIASTDRHLQTTDIRFEPRNALEAGEDGLDALKTIYAQAAGYLNPGGWLITEHGFDQQAAVADLATNNGFTQIQCHHDYAGLPRVTECCKSTDKEFP